MPSLSVAPAFLEVFKRGVASSLRKGLDKVGEFDTKRRANRPEVSVIVPLYNVEQYVSETLESLVSQTLSNIEIIVIDDGSTDSSLQLAYEAASNDSRIRVIKKSKNTGLSETRNLGVSEARGRYLAFIDSDDVLEKDALKKSVQSLNKSNSDFAVFGYYRFNSSRRWNAAPWILSIHRKMLTGVRPADHPEIMANAISCSKIYRASWWNRNKFQFKPGVLYEDQAVTARAYAIARKIDVIPSYELGWRAREDGSSISQQIHSTSDLQARIDAAEHSLSIIQGLGRPELYEERFAQLLANDFPMSVGAVPDASLEYFELLLAQIGEKVKSAPEWMWARMSPQARVAYELLIQNRRKDLISFYGLGGGNLKNFETFMLNGKVYSKLPFSDDAMLNLAVERLELLPRQLKLVSSIRKVQWVSHTTLEISAWAYIDNIDTKNYTYEITTSLVNSSTNEKIDLALNRIPNSEISEISKHKWCNYENATFTTLIDVSDKRISENRGRWVLHVNVSDGDRKYSEALHGLSNWGSTGHMSNVPVGTNHFVLPKRTARGELEIYSYVPFCTANSVKITSREVLLNLTSTHSDELISVSFENYAHGVTVHSKTVDRLKDGTLNVAINLPRLIDRPQRDRHGMENEWIIRATRSAKNSSRRSPIALNCNSFEFAASDQLRPDQTFAGNLSVWEQGPIVMCNSISIDDDGFLRISIKAAGNWKERPWLTIRRKDVELHAVQSKDRGSGEFEMIFDLRASRWGKPELPLASAAYWILPYHGAERVLLKPAADLISQLPLSYIGGSLANYRIDYSPERKLTLRVSPPLKQDELGVRNQRELQDHYKAFVPEVIENSILTRSYYGESATCNAAALHVVLEKLRPEVEFFMAVKDYSVPLPPGAIPVLHTSRRWYELLKSVEIYMDNMHQPIYFEKQSHQRVIQTFHGYPFKAMGHENWVAARVSATQISSFDERANQWDYVVSPAPYATPLLREAFRYSGQFLEIGYPRNDVLLQDNNQEIRDLIRKNLGIPASQTVVMYAPTFRDYLATSDQKAPMIDFIDLDGLIDRLGQNYTLLLRGHAFNTRAGSSIDTKSASIIDVSEYPDVAELYLAADIVVADYSSLRFDFGVTGKPMVFYVPDLEMYRNNRDWLLPFEDTAPGPIVTTQEELAHALGNIDSVNSRYSERYKKFRNSYLSLEDGGASERLALALYPELQD